MKFVVANKRRQGVKVETHSDLVSGREASEVEEVAGSIKGPSQMAFRPVPDWDSWRRTAPDPCQRRRSRALLQPPT